MTKMTPLECVQLQLDAYNERDLDTFLTAFSETVQSYHLPHMTLLLDGKAAFGAFYAANRFVHEGLRADLVNRMVVGNMVIDHETVTRNFPEGRGEVDVVCIYEIEHGKIAKAWFKMGERRLSSRQA